MRFLLAILCVSLSVQSEPAISSVNDELIRRQIQREGVTLIENRSAPSIGELFGKKLPARFRAKLPKTSGKTLASTEIYKTIAPGVVIVSRLYNCGKCSKIHHADASGFVIAEDGLIATNHHVVEADTGNLVISTFDGKVYPVTDVVALDKKRDLVVLRVKATGLNPLPLAAGASPGDRVHVISHPNGNFYSLTQGIVSRYLVEQETGLDRIAVTAAFGKGSSGAPIVNDRGEVVGLVASTRALYYDTQKGRPSNLQMVFKHGVPIQHLRQMRDTRLSELQNGTTTIDAPGVPGVLCTFGEDALPLVTAPSGNAEMSVIAVSSLGKGRVAAFGHTDYIRPQSLAKADTGHLILNIFHWLSDKKDRKVAVLNNAGFASWLNGHKIAAESLTTDWPTRLKEFDILCTGPWNFSSQQQNDIVKFIRGGGAFVMADCPWGWLQIHPGKNLMDDHSGNQILAHAGLAFADGYTRRNTPNGFNVTEPNPLCNASVALDALISDKSDPKHLRQISAILLAASRVVPKHDSIIRPDIDRLSTAGPSAIPSEKKPLTLNKHPRQRIELALQLQQMASLPPEKTTAHPAAAHFPGEVPASAKRIEHSISIDMQAPDWHSTGLYAPAGEIITVSAKTEFPKGLSLVIGCHKDRLWDKDAWKRVPEISKSVSITGQTTKAASPFGGLIYIQVPRSRKGTLELAISGAVQAPYFVLGKTTNEEWKSIRERPAPWAELACSSIVYSVPSECIRLLDDPTALMTTWDDVMNATADLAVRPRKRTRPERFVLDVQISAGYMHSGYPIMAHLDAVYSMDRKKLLSGLWGNFHEIGHNHQDGMWTFSGTTEVTCNLFTLYVYEKVCGISPEKNDRTNPLQMQARITKYFADGAKFENWKRQPFTALMMYVQLQQAFGWETFKKVFKEYQQLPSAQRPKTDDEKRDQWMVRFSKAIGKDLGPFFEAWNVPTSEKARDSISDLPKWMPGDFPPDVSR